MHVMANDFRESLISHLASSGMTVPELARRSGVSKDLLNKLKQRVSNTTNVEDAVRIARCFGYTVEEFIGSTQEDRTAEQRRLFAQLSPVEQEIVQAQIAGLLARKAKKD